MTGGGATKTKLPPEADPTPTPEDIDLEAQRRAEDVRRKLVSKRGRRGTILTQEDLGLEGKKTVLG